MANLGTLTQCIPPQLLYYLVSTREQTLQEFVHAEGDAWEVDYDRLLGDGECDPLLGKVGLWKEANNGKTAFNIGDRIIIPGRIAAMQAWLRSIKY